ncbi:SIMPL domain-containing protein [Rhizobium sp. SG2393]|uniref:SIMPL domain-containing protein n=1 Tax=Rhizobium sp. SG2393 TaxID=3276279 RepID=UPI00366F7D99
MTDFIAVPRRLAGALLLAALASTAALPALAAEGPQKGVIVVTGEGSAQVAPDIAIISLGVQETAATAREAVTATNTAMEKVLAALKEDGIAERDMQTSGFSINPQYTYYDNSNGENRPPKLTGYQANNALTVKLRDLKRLGDLLDRSVTLGVNQGGTVQFANDDPKAAMTQARKQAVSEAVEKAKTMADAAGIKVGRVLEISETMGQPIPMPQMMRTMAKDAGAESVPIAAGENNYTVSVSMRFEIGD